jgi:hypothetical protein
MNISLVRLLVALGHINPAIWDAIIPHGPAHISISSKGAEVALNPQPLPPLELASVKVANQIAQAAIAAEAAGNDSGPAIVSRAIDDWCGNSPHHFPIPWPGPWPFPWAPHRGDAELDAEASQTIGALTLASVASRMADGDVRNALADGAEQLLQAAVGK